MAPRQSKRTAAPAASTSASKKAKSSPAFAHVAEIIQQSTLPEDVSKMLVAMIPFCLGPCADERLSIQERAVAMIGEVVDQVTKSKEVVLTEAQAGIVAMFASKEGLGKTASVSEEALRTAFDLVKEKAALVETRTAETLKAKRLLSKTQDGHTDAKAELEKWQTEKGTYEEATGTHFAILKDGSCEAKDAPQHVNAIMPLIVKLGLDQSLATVAPTALAKRPEDRGAFDGMIIKQLEAGFTEKLSALDNAIEAAAPIAQERAAAKHDSERGLHLAQEAEASATAEAMSARVAHAGAASALKQAQAAINDYEPRLKAATQRRDEASSQLDAFLRFHVASFTESRDKIAKEVEDSVAASLVHVEPLQPLPSVTGDDISRDIEVTPATEPTILVSIVAGDSVSSACSKVMPAAATQSPAAVLAEAGA